MKNEVYKEKERPGQYIDAESPFCRNCTRDDGWLAGHSIGK